MQRAKPKSAVIQGTLVLFGTFGIIVPLAVLVLPSTGKFPPPRPIIQEIAPESFPRPPKSQLTLYLRGIHELENIKKQRPNAAQWQQIVDTLDAWQKRPSMTDDDADRVLDKLDQALTHAQRLWLKNWMESYLSYSPPVFPSDKRGFAMQIFRATYNPFVPPAKHKMFGVLPKEMRERYQIRYDERMDIIKQWRAITK